MQKIALAAALTIVLSTSAFAQTAEEQNLCMNDAFRVCSHTIPDRGRTVACMVEKKTQLSRPCQEVMDRYAQPTDHDRVRRALLRSPRRSAPCQERLDEAGQDRDRAAPRQAAQHPDALSATT